MLCKSLKCFDVLLLTSDPVRHTPEVLERQQSELPLRDGKQLTCSLSGFTDELTELLICPETCVESSLCDDCSHSQHTVAIQPSHTTSAGKISHQI